MSILPKIMLDEKKYNDKTKKLFVVAEGFEKRSIHWISNLDNSTAFDNAIICRYSPSKKSRFEEMIRLVRNHCDREPIIMDYNRFEPTVFEQDFKKIIQDYSETQEIIIDISVMSKMLIMIILGCCNSYNGKVTIIYTEPCRWGPSHEKYLTAINNRTQGQCIGLSSVGVGNVVRTPNLSSVIMQGCPTFLVAFLSFNEQLINVLVNEINPSKLFVINHSCNGAEWREQAMYDIHKNLINDFSNNDAKTNINNHLKSFAMLEYDKLFGFLAELYNDYCYNYRFVISPTGCKLHAVSCALLKLCCPDIHVEYPTPESYLFNEYSSDDIANVHHISFNNFSDFIVELANEYHLNG